jgi:DNA-binding HxlR family transcriptional regulator
MYEKKIPEDLSCGINISMKVFGAKWKPCIIDAISRGIRRPSEIHREISAASPRVIDVQLRELEDHGIVIRSVYSGFPLHVEYSLTNTGKSILPVIEMLSDWGIANRNIVSQSVPGSLKYDDHHAPLQNKPCQ